MKMEPSLYYNCQIDISRGLVTTKRKTQHPGCVNKASGYMTVMLQKKGDKLYAPYYVHRIIWEQANQCPIPAGFHVHHIDANRKNNSIYNLSLVTQRLNNWFAAKNRDYKKIYQARKARGFKAKITACTVDEKGKKTKLHFDSMRQCASHFNKNVSTISNIVNKKKYFTTVDLNGKTYNFERTVKDAVAKKSV